MLHEGDGVNGCQLRPRGRMGFRRARRSRLCSGMTGFEVTARWQNRRTRGRLVAPGRAAEPRLGGAAGSAYLRAAGDLRLQCGFKRTGARVLLRTAGVVGAVAWRRAEGGR